jgi:hypothetical protein
MRTRIGCLHAHYSNIDYIDKELASDDLELVHFVDPGLMYRISTATNLDSAGIQERVISQLEWISQSKVDAILITCTNYIALLKEDQTEIPVPIFKIDEPFFSYVTDVEEPQILLFTNPATVDGTMQRLNEYSSRQGKSLDIEVRVIENTFDLIMQGKKEQYEAEVSMYIKGLLQTAGNKVISVTQLSMVDSARNVEAEMNVRVPNPLSALKAYMEEALPQREG